MKKLLMLLKEYNLEMDITCNGDSFLIRVMGPDRSIGIHLDVFDVRREYKERELCDLIYDYICDKLGVPKF